jgi:hypothetical protein
MRPLLLSRPAWPEFLQPTQEQRNATQKPLVLPSHSAPPKAGKMIKYESSTLPNVLVLNAATEFCGNGAEP